jgi:hypothetical protein
MNINHLEQVTFLKSPQNFSDGVGGRGVEACEDRVPNA